MRRSIGLLALVCGMGPIPAAAQSLASCGVSVTPIAFGAYDPTSPADMKPTGSVTASCNLLLGLSLGVAYSITLSPGSSGTYSARKMGGTSTPLYYNLYTSSGLTQIWGDGVTGGTGAQGDAYLLGTGGAVKTYTIFAKLPARQLVAAGAYADSVTVTISY